MTDGTRYVIQYRTTEDGPWYDLPGRSALPTKEVGRNWLGTLRKEADEEHGPGHPLQYRLARRVTTTKALPD